MTIREHDCVVLTASFPAKRLKQGDVGTAIHIYDEGKACEVELVALDGATIAVVTVEVSRVRPVSRCETRHARSLA
jgi:hypothetical protein